MQNNQKAYQLFASFKNKYYQDDQEVTQKTEVDLFRLDDEMKNLLQKINKQSKKSSATRLKALQQTSEIILSKDEDYIDAFLKVFTIVYEKIVTCEEDTKVLFELQKCMRGILTKGENVVKKKFAHVFHYLYFSCFEQNAELREIAKQNLAILLKSDDKIARSAFLFHDKVFGLLLNILTDKAAFMNNMSIYDDKEVNQIIYNKLAGMCWFCLADMVEKSVHLKPSDQTELLAKITQLTLQSENSLLLNTLNSSKDDYTLKTGVLNLTLLKG